MSIGLILAGVISLARGALHGWIAVVIAGAVLATMLASKINPALLVLGGAVVGLIVFRT